MFSEYPGLPNEYSNWIDDYKYAWDDIATENEDNKENRTESILSIANNGNTRIGKQYPKEKVALRFYSAGL